MAKFGCLQLHTQYIYAYIIMPNDKCLLFQNINWINMIYKMNKKHEFLTHQIPTAMIHLLHGMSKMHFFLLHQENS